MRQSLLWLASFLVTRAVAYGVAVGGFHGAARDAGLTAASTEWARAGATVMGVSRKRRKQEAAE